MATSKRVRMLCTCRPKKGKQAGLFALMLAASLALAAGVRQQAPPADRSLLLQPDAPEINQRAPGTFAVRLETSKGVIALEVRRDWAPLGGDRFYNLVRAGYYDGNRFFRVIKDRWAQFGINGDPAVAKLWRDRPIADDPAGQSNVRGTVAFAFAAYSTHRDHSFHGIVNAQSTTS
jgi:hypothetical protein